MTKAPPRHASSAPRVGLRTFARVQVVRAFAVALAAATLLHVRDTGVGAQVPDDLKFFKNYFVTGDYVVAGVGLRGTGVDGTATGNIDVQGVPAGAEIVSAQLYWQVVSDTGPLAGSVGARFKG